MNDRLQDAEARTMVFPRNKLDRGGAVVARLLELPGAHRAAFLNLYQDERPATSYVPRHAEDAS